jgi:hypothetical protein
LSSLFLIIIFRHFHSFFLSSSTQPLVFPLSIFQFVLIYPSTKFISHFHRCNSPQTLAIIYPNQNG